MVPAVRLVRACGSKLWRIVPFLPDGSGQARKSLWIETSVHVLGHYVVGQARKSLWIETMH